MIKGPSEHEPILQIEVAGLPTGLAQRLLAELDQLRADLNVYRGHLLDVSLNPMGGVVLTFTGPPGITRDDVVLPVTVLARSSGMPSEWSATGRRCYPLGSTSNAACCFTAPPAPAKRTPRATCWVR